MQRAKTDPKNPIYIRIRLLTPRGGLCFSQLEGPIELGGSKRLRIKILKPLHPLYTYKMNHTHCYMMNHMHIKSPIRIPARTASIWGMLLWVWVFFYFKYYNYPPGFLGDLGCFQLKLKLKSGEKQVSLCKVRKHRVIRLGAGSRTEKPGTPRSWVGPCDGPALPV